MAINLIPNLSYPQNSEVNVPIGSSIVLFFDKEVDIQSIKDSCILTGPDYDFSSGPDNTVWMLNNNKSDNYLRSPGYSGFVKFDVELRYYDPVNNVELSDVIDIDRVPNIYTMAILTPEKVLALDVKYTLHIIGANTLSNAIATTNCVSERTIYTGSLDGNLTKRARIKGTYNQSNDVTLNCKIVKSGIGSEAQYVWWFSNEAMPNNSGARLLKCTSRWRSLDRGIVIRFEESEYTIGEIYQFKCYQRSNLTDSHLIHFTTGNSGVYTESDYSLTSTSEIDINIPTRVRPVDTNRFEIVSIEPYKTEINVPIDTKYFIITFSKPVDPLSVTQANIKIKSFPVSGFYQSKKSIPNREYEVYKILSVEDNKIIIEV